MMFDATEVVRVHNEYRGVPGQIEKGPFIWAEEIEIDRVRICEMGARNVADVDLGQEYTVVAEKTISP